MTTNPHEDMAAILRRQMGQLKADIEVGRLADPQHGAHELLARAGQDLQQLGIQMPAGARVIQFLQRPHIAADGGFAGSPSRALGMVPA